MAALQDATLPDVVELLQLTAADLEPVLNEEIDVWQRRFYWDFRTSADLLRRFLQLRSLCGYALRIRKEIVGYSYYVCEGRKGLIGDFYVRADCATSSNETMLLGAVVQGMMLAPGVRRVECQLMLLQSPVPHTPFSSYATRHDRYFMEIDRESTERLSPISLGVSVTLTGWAERYHEEIAHLVSAAYRGHVDSDINDQYRSIPGARHFLTNIIRFPGCGQFSPGASIVAIDHRSGRVCGVCLASKVSEASGHVTQLCVLPALRRAGLGYELLRHCLSKLVSLGCTSTSLTVTCSNTEAIRLYESMGFRSQAKFPAFVWEGWKS